MTVPIRIRTAVYALAFCFTLVAGTANAQLYFGANGSYDTYFGTAFAAEAGILDLGSALPGTDLGLRGKFGVYDLSTSQYRLSADVLVGNRLPLLPLSIYGFGGLDVTTNPPAGSYEKWPVHVGALAHLALEGGIKVSAELDFGFGNYTPSGATESQLYSNTAVSLGIAFYIF